MTEEEFNTWKMDRIIFWMKEARRIEDAKKIYWEARKSNGNEFAKRAWHQAFGDKEKTGAA